MVIFYYKHLKKSGQYVIVCKSDYLRGFWVLWFFIKTTSTTWIIRYASKQYSFIMWSSPKDTIKEQSSASAAPWKHLWSFKKASHARSTLPLDPLVNWSGVLPRHPGLSKLPRGADAQQWKSLLKQNFSNFSAEKWVF